MFSASRLYILFLIFISLAIFSHIRGNPVAEAITFGVSFVLLFPILWFAVCRVYSAFHDFFSGYIALVAKKQKK